MNTIEIYEKQLLELEQIGSGFNKKVERFRLAAYLTIMSVGSLAVVLTLLFGTPIKAGFMTFLVLTLASILLISEFEFLLTRLVKPGETEALINKLSDISKMIMEHGETKQAEELAKKIIKQKRQVHINSLYETYIHARSALKERISKEEANDYLMSADKQMEAAKQ